MKKKLRINITNNCNLQCSFCCVYGSPKNYSYINFDTFKKIVDEFKDYDLTVKLEGGEPLLHPNIFLFIEYLATFKKIKEIIIQTNGIMLDKYADKLFEDAERLNVKINLKIAINESVLKNHDNHMAKCKSLYNKSLITQNISVTFAVRYLNENDLENMLKEIDKYNISRDYCDIDIFYAYGRLTDSDYPKLMLPETSCWSCYASDGKCFNNDLVGRSKHEKLIIENLPRYEPVFDYKNHIQMWRDTMQYLSGITFQNKYCIDNWCSDFQKQYIEEHLNSFTQFMIQERIYNYAKYYATRFQGINYCQHDPFVIGIKYDCCGENLMREFYLNEQAMFRTTDKDNFYRYKNMAMEIADKISKLNIRDGIKITLTNI